MPKIGDTQPALEIRAFLETDVTRSPMRVDLGCAVLGAAQPVPDISDAPNFYAGLQHRVGRQPPKMSRTILRRLRRFAARFARENFSPLTQDQIPDTEEWILSRPYTKSRKTQLLELYRTMVKDVPFNQLPRWSTKVKAFIKDECYDGEYKIPRGIYSRDDIFKIYSGPMFSALENIVYSHHSFIKHCPVPDRPAYMSNVLFQPDSLLSASVGPIGPSGPICVCNGLQSMGHTAHDGSSSSKDAPVVARPPSRYCRVHMPFGPGGPNRDRTAKWRSYGSDYSSFESHFSAEVMDNIEFVVYRSIAARLPCELRLCLENILCTLAGTNSIQCRRFGTAKLNACRMSGEMNTSLGNGISNLIVNLFVLNQLGVKRVQGVIEGDDGLFRYFGPEVTAWDFKMTGFTIKISHVTESNKASFCGIIYDIDDCVNVTNPISGLLEFGWGGGKYRAASDKTRMALLRAKSLSLLYSYPGCPILQSLALYGLRITEGMHYRIPRDISMYEKEEYAKAVKYIKENGLPIRIVPVRTRVLVEEIYGISIDVQMSIESKLDSMTKLENLDFPELLSLFKPDQISFYNLYMYSDVGRIDLCLPRQKLLTQPIYVKRGLVEWNKYFTTGGRTLLAPTGGQKK